MTRNDKTPVAPGVCHCAEPCKICNCMISINTQKYKVFAGTPLASASNCSRAGLAALQDHHGNKLRSQELSTDGTETEKEAQT